MTDFYFTLLLSEAEFHNLKVQIGNLNLKSQIAISSSDWGGRRHPPYAFTEQGVAMLSSVLRSKRAVQVNIEIMRAIVRLREMLTTHKDPARKFESHDMHIRSLFEAIRQLMKPPEPKKRKIGFLVRERAARYGRG